MQHIKPMDLEKPLVFYSSPPSLKNITSTSIAIYLWSEQIAEGTFEHTFFDKPCQFKFDNTLPIPRVLAILINRDINAIREQIKKWVNYFACRLFPSHGIVFDVLKKYFDRIVWNVDGTIDDLRTARDMLKWPRLSLLNKFRIACIYCFAEDVRKIKPQLSPEINLARYTYDEDPLLYYWEHQYRDHVEGMITRDLRLEPRRIIDHCKVDRWPPIEFFFGQARQPEQRRRITSMIICHGNSFYIKKVLLLLDEVQLEYVIWKFASDIMICFLSCPNSRQIAVQTWSYMKDRINEVHLGILIRWMLTFEAAFSQPMHKELASAFMEIWTQCPSRLKQSCLREILNNPALFEYHGGNFKKLPRDLKFVTRVISDASRRMRNHFWRNNWHLLIRGSRPVYLNDLIKMCLDAEEIDRFKENTMGEFEFIKEYCGVLIEQRCYNEMDAYLTFCHRDRKKNLQLQRQVVQFYFPIKKDCLNDQSSEISEECLRIMDFYFGKFEEFRLSTNRAEDASADRRDNLTSLRKQTLLRFFRRMFLRNNNCTLM